MMMPVLSSLLFTSLAAILSPPALQAEDSCPPAASESVSSQALLAQADARIAAGDVAGARELLRQAVPAGGESSASRVALLKLISLARPEDEDGFVELMACVSPQSRILAKGSMLLARGEPEAAIGVFAGEVLPRHHTMPRWSIMHERLGDAFAAMGRTADAQAQWRLALATDYDPGGTLWDPASVQSKLESAQSEGGIAPLLPLIRYHDAMAILIADSVERTEDGVAYSKLVLLQEDSGETAYGIDRYEVRCDEPDRRVLGVRGYGKDGATVRELGPMSWERDRAGDPFLPTERRLVCAFPTDAEIAAQDADYAAMLAAYRAGQDPFR